MWCSQFTVLLICTHFSISLRTLSFGPQWTLLFCFRVDEREKQIEDVHLRIGARERLHSSWPAHVEKIQLSTDCSCCAQRCFGIRWENRWNLVHSFGTVFRRKYGIHWKKSFLCSLDNSADRVSVRTRKDTNQRHVAAQPVDAGVWGFGVYVTSQVVSARPARDPLANFLHGDGGFSHKLSPSCCPYERFLFSPLCAIWNTVWLVRFCEPCQAR